MTGPFDLTAPDPYDNQPWDQPVQGPWLASVVLHEADAVPERFPILGDDGFVIGWREVPERRCIGCSVLTRRRIILAVHVTAFVRNEGVFACETAAQCVACSQRGIT